MRLIWTPARVLTSVANIEQNKHGGLEFKTTAAWLSYILSEMHMTIDISSHGQASNSGLEFRAKVSLRACTEYGLLAPWACCPPTIIQCMASNMRHATLIGSVWSSTFIRLASLGNFFLVRVGTVYAPWLNRKTTDISSDLKACERKITNTYRPYYRFLLRDILIVTLHPPPHVYMIKISINNSSNPPLAVPIKHP